MPWVVRIAVFVVAIFLGKMVFLPTLTVEELQLATDIRDPLYQRGTPYIECAFSNMEYSYQTIWLPSVWAQLVTERGEYDGYFMASKNDQRDLNAVLSEPFLSAEWLYVVRKDSGLTPSGSNFHRGTFAANLGGAQHSWLEDKFNNGEIVNEIVGAQGATTSMNMLALGLIDVNLVNGANLENAFKEAGLNPSDFQTFVASTLPMGIYFGKVFLESEPGFLNAFNESMKGC